VNANYSANPKSGRLRVQSAMVAAMSRVQSPFLPLSAAGNRVGNPVFHDVKMP